MKEKKKSKALIPGDFKYIFAGARLSKPFTVIEMQQSDFKDFSQLEKALVKNPKMKITEGMWFKITFDDPLNVYVRSSHNIMRPWSIYQIHGKKTNIYSVSNLPEIYTEIIPVSDEKRKDLIDICEYLPPGKKAFYQDLLKF